MWRVEYEKIHPPYQKLPSIAHSSNWAKKSKEKGNITSLIFLDLRVFCAREWRPGWSWTFWQRGCPGPLPVCPCQPTGRLRPSSCPADQAGLWTSGRAKGRCPACPWPEIKKKTSHNLSINISFTQVTAGHLQKKSVNIFHLLRSVFVIDLN